MVKQKECALGFDCAGMMQVVGIDPADCDNYLTCRAARGLGPDDEFELIRRIGRTPEEQQQWQEWAERAAARWNSEREIIRTTRRRLALAMLMQRGCPQTVESLGLLSLYNEIMDLTIDLSEHFNSYQDEYIAPPECEVHVYSVRRPWGTYGYNKLTAKQNIFEPADRSFKVKVIHLSGDDDPRNLLAREGIQRRNKLLKTKTKLQEVARLLRECLE
ncbi:hypothetical protein [Gloeothece verrucosa]|uniref:Uncharacterized protein n=1 Tax=Gloeothece verrucosa (strain PCC 7822) TaxID=497965 RepID=E0UNT6_GLOV7|nr:hypothetical protein [Gloeothece verrucosa]ADN18616.1 conserved hypothetical protein [Gloeothece verrucosa PCC 7822]